MTRKKWNRLRRTRPELFSNLPPWEKMHDYERSIMRRVSKARAITVMTTWLLRGEAGMIGDLAIPAPPETLRPVEVPGLAGNLWTADVGYPPQSWPGVEVGQDSFTVDGIYAKHNP